ncbi:LysE family translocator [Cochlodiniinecator piscidefendens]|uniref:LysE family translocator n=1 Tax=Cochlodiniinecator piscidefendens TaxID=2715756 RepID=UPI00140B8639|nr:LysE family translocator [Cochlodiniinecator piscidefendens]
MNLALWISFLTVSAVNIVTPGPANMNTVRRAVQLGSKRVIPTIFGNAFGLAVGGVVCAAGIASFVMTSSVLWSLFQWLGIFYLAGLGIKLLIKKEPLSSNSSADVSIRAKKLFSEAFLLAATNPKALLFYMALFPQTLDQERSILLQASVMILTYCGLSILSLSTYSVLADFLRTQLMTQERYDKFRQVSGMVLILFAIKLTS